MKDPGLQRAIEAAGGVGALARALGIAQPSVSNWSRVPAERVIAVEAATGVPRGDLRPDLYPADPAQAADAPREVHEVDLARARLYLLLGRLIRRAPDAAFLADLSALKGDATEIGMALVELSAAAAASNADRIAREYFALFVGVGRGELLPYASFYLAGFLNERPLARVREDLARLGIERVEGDFEPEDNAGTLFEIMAGLADGTFATDEAEERRFFERHLSPWIGRFFADLEQAGSADFYRSVARLGRAFTTLEAEGYALAA